MKKICQASFCNKVFIFAPKFKTITMKKIYLGIAGLALFLAACSTSQSTIRQVDINDTNLITEPKLVRYDVNLNKKLTATVKMNKKYGVEYAKSAAVAEALKTDPTADLIVDPQYQIKSSLMSIEVTVTGYWGKYTSIETLDTSLMKYYMDFNAVNGAAPVVSSPLKMNLFKK